MHSPVSDRKCLRSTVSTVNGNTAGFPLNALADSCSQHYCSANTTHGLHLLHSGDVFKLFIATTKAEIKAHNLNHGSEIRDIFQNKLCLLLLLLSFPI